MTCIGRRTEILRSARCFESCGLVCMFGRLLVAENRIGHTIPRRLLLKKLFSLRRALRWAFVLRVPIVSSSLPFPTPMGKPACELLHFSHSIGLVRGS